MLEPEKVPNVNADELQKKGSKDKKNKISVEVTPVRKYAMIKDHLLILSDSDGSKAIIQLLGCTVAAVSASDLPTRKW